MYTHTYIYTHKKSVHASLRHSLAIFCESAYHARGLLLRLNQITLLQRLRINLLLFARIHSSKTLVKRIYCGL